MKPKDYMDGYTIGNMKQEFMLYTLFNRKLLLPKVKDIQNYRDLIKEIPDESHMNM